MLPWSVEQIGDFASTTLFAEHGTAFAGSSQPSPDSPKAAVENSTQAESGASGAAEADKTGAAQQQGSAPSKEEAPKESGGGM